MFTYFHPAGCAAAAVLVLLTGCSVAPDAAATGTTTLPAAAGAVRPTETASTTEEPPEMIHYLALGDSYTIGESVPEQSRWPVLLAGLLRQAGIPVQDPQIVARTGWTTGELQAAMAGTQFEREYGLVSLLIGVNNQYRRYEIEPYRAEFSALLKQAIAFAGGDPTRVLVLSIPDWGATPFAARDSRTPETIAAEITAFNIVNREEALRLGARYVDIFAVSQRAAAEPDLTAVDGLHPSALQYALWAEAALPAALAALGK